MNEAVKNPKSLKAQITRTSLVLAAAALLREEGPGAVTYRKVAKWAGAASSSVGYYFESTSQLLQEAARYNMQLWIQRADNVAAEAESMDCAKCRANVVDLLVKACLPNEDTQLSAHYLQLLLADESPSVTEAYRTGRASLNRAIERIVTRSGVALSSDMVSILVDGAIVQGISEGRSAREFATEVLNTYIETHAVMA
ncbi:TetR/AcrR family transcriptional regulator [Adlercreutzia sp. ZJ141]|uniref:TetR/AcrR family transcriptional regulator n=1 Tax=Adlercreutzia sp. ZJ141 TaxID=2709406 RepID=UPI0013EAB221|nr:TetR family transcriptional regulator [Adlercreutzia sp. ZJ141]